MFQQKNTRDIYEIKTLLSETFYFWNLSDFLCNYFNLTTPLLSNVFIQLRIHRNQIVSASQINYEGFELKGLRLHRSAYVQRNSIIQTKNKVKQNAVSSHPSNINGMSCLKQGIITICTDRVKLTRKNPLNENKLSNNL